MYVQWTEAHAPTLPVGEPSARGAALYQQLEDKTITLVTAHWESVAQHHEWIGSAENQTAMADLGPMIDPSRVEFFHVEGVEMFPADTIEHGLLTVLRIGVSGEEKERLEGIWKEARELLQSAAGCEFRAGWKIEKGDRDEFVVVGAWKQKVALVDFMNGRWAGKEEWDRKWNEAGAMVDVKNYEKLV